MCGIGYIRSCLNAFLNILCDISSIAYSLGSVCDSVYMLQVFYSSDNRDDSDCVKGHTCKIRQGDTVLIPATSKGVRFKPAAGAGLKLVTSYIR